MAIQPASDTAGRRRVWSDGPHRGPFSCARLRLGRPEGLELGADCITFGLQRADRLGLPRDLPVGVLQGGTNGSRTDRV